MIQIHNNLLVTLNKTWLTVRWGWAWYEKIMPIAASEICIILYIIQKPNSIIIVLLSIQNISRALKTQNAFLKMDSHFGKEFAQNQSKMKKYLEQIIKLLLIMLL